MDEVREALDRAIGEWSYIVIDANHWGLGKTEAEARRNVPECECLTGGRVGRFSAPTKVVVDCFGRIHWPDPEVGLDWLGKAS